MALCGLISKKLKDISDARGCVTRLDVIGRRDQHHSWVHVMALSGRKLKVQSLPKTT